MKSKSSHLMESSITIYSAALILSCFLILSTSYGGGGGGDTLTQGQSLNDGNNGQSLISAGDVFELGFFSPPNSNSRYVGIWYRGVSPLSVVWVANRASPVPSSAGILTFAGDGNIAVLDDGGKAFWSTNYKSTGLKNLSATLMSSGNLVINSIDSVSLWESFDHPTDTFLPGMKLVLNQTSGVNQLLTSWKSSGDPTAGNFTLGLDPRGSSQIFIWAAGEPWWRSGEWNRETFIGTMMRPLFIFGFNLVNDVSRGVMELTFAQFNTSLFRFALQWDGIENTTMLVDEGNDPYWETVWLQPIHPCEIYGKCGAYGVCSDDGGSATCICMKGFDPKSIYEWNRGNWSGGCSRRTPLQCQLSRNETSGSGKEDGFFAVEGVKLPDSSDWGSTVGSEADCRTACSSNCTCEAYAYVSGIGCMIWGRYLIDTYRFTEGGNDLNIKLADSELATKARTWKIIVIFSTLGVAIAVLLLCIFLWWKCNARLKEWWNKNVGKRLESLKFSSLRFSREVNLDFSGSSEVGEKSAEQLPFYSFGSLATATNNFSESNKLGEGGFGKVYKGMLPGGQEVAVKRLSTNSGQGIQEFKNEMRLIANLQHRNLVRLVGCCIQEGEKILLYEYMLNKSLDAFIFDPTNQTLLNWNKRFNIIEGIARGLLYLHRDSRLRIVHRDLKASNILLDQDMNPKISDFGMARIFGGDQNEGNTIRVVGTYGYMSPEYAMEGLFSVKSDVYSFGILVLEIVTGRRSNSFHRDKSFLNIVGYAWDFWQEDRAMELIDPSIRVSCSSQEVIRCVHVALLCLQDRADDRPEMSSVVHMLGSESAISPMPKQPKFILVQSPKGKGNYDNFSKNDVTITELQAR